MTTTIAPETLAAMDARHDRMERAFRFVDPAARATAALGRANHGVTWKDQIGSLVLASELADAGVTIEEVADAVEYFTATQPTVSAERIGSRWGVDHGGAHGWLVIADGYRRGPAGDH